MPRVKGTTDAQSSFLRACAKSPAGLPAERWPSAVTMRRWLRRPGFRAALQGIRDTLRVQADLHLASAATAAAKRLADVVSSAAMDAVDSAEQLKATRDLVHSLSSLLRLAHLRQRFATDIPLPSQRPPLTDEMRAALDDFRWVVERGAHPDHTVSEARRLLEILENDAPPAYDEAR